MNEEKGERSSNRPFPVTDSNYHSIALGGQGGRCVKFESPSFHSLSRDYFKTEARQNSLTDTVVFGAIMATTALPLLNGVLAVIALMRSTGTF